MRSRTIAIAGTIVALGAAAGPISSADRSGVDRSADRHDR
jgi:hypothetical protein